MSRTSHIRSTILAASALSVLAACTQADLEDIASPGSGQPVVVTPIPPATGGGTVAAFASRSTAPTSQANCPTGTFFEPNVQIATGVSTNFCSLTDLAANGTPVQANQTRTGTVNIPLSTDPILISGSVFLGDGAAGVANFTFAAGQRFIARQAQDVVDLLVVARGSQLAAVGTPSNPIIFTSLLDFTDDGMPNGSRPVDARDWGGLVINGRAPLNQCTVDASATAGTDACRQNGEGGSGVFGGADANDSSGNYQYIRVQHAGFLFSASNELNSIALQGVGAGTRMSFIQIVRGADDGFEWFGGTVNGDHFIVTGANDDMYDWTDGWTGRVQFALGIQDATDDNGIEADNNGDTNPGPDALPRSAPRFSNFTLIGDGGTGTSGEGIQVRAGTAGSIINGIVTNFEQGLEFNPAGTGPNPVINSVGLLGVNADFGSSQSSGLFSNGGNNRLFPSNTLSGVFPGINEAAIPALNPTTVDPAFVGGAAGTFAGAFGPSDTPSSNWTTGWSVNVPTGAAVTACPAGTVLASESPTTASRGTLGGTGFPGRTETRICIITSPVSGAVRLVAGNLYRIDGSVFVGVDGGPTAGAGIGTQGVLTVDPGVTIFGNRLTGVADQLIVTRGSQIIVNGSPVAPAVLTSREDLGNGGVVRPLATEEIGGLTLNGRAPLNQCTVDATAAPGSANCAQNGEGGSGVFGGATFNDNSGRINYLQIRYAGIRFSTENELNSLNLQGVGNGTEIDFIQVINGGDDGIEWFGGNVNVRHAVITGAQDDSIDWTDGWTGTLQYAIVRQNTGDDNGIEADNNGDTNPGPDALPRSRGFVSNVTLIGDGASGEAAQYRAGTGGGLVNSIVTNFAEAFEFGAAGTGPNPIVDAVAFSGVQSPTPLAPVFTTPGTIISSGANNRSTNANTLTAPTGFTTRILPGANETAPAIPAINPRTPCGTVYTGVAATEAVNPCATLDITSFVGAVNGPTDTWYVGWTLGL